MLVGAYVVAGGPFSGVGSTVLVLVLLGTFYVATDGVLSALVSQLAVPEARATGIASSQTVVALGWFAASMLFGALGVATAQAPALLIIAAVLALAVPFAWWLPRDVARGSAAVSTA